MKEQSAVSLRSVPSYEAGAAATRPRSHWPSVPAPGWPHCGIQVTLPGQQGMAFVGDSSSCKGGEGLGSASVGEQLLSTYVCQVQHPWEAATPQGLRSHSDPLPDPNYAPSQEAE